MSDDFTVRAAAGSLRADVQAVVDFPHQWTEQGVAVEAPFTGAHLLHLAAAACVLNDLYRESAALGIAVDGVLVEAGGTFDTTDWHSEGITYRVQVASAASDDEINALVARVDEVAEIPKVIRAGASVDRRTETLD